jgi:hypothetical protein
LGPLRKLAPLGRATGTKIEVDLPSWARSRPGFTSAPTPLRLRLLPLRLRQDYVRVRLRRSMRPCRSALKRFLQRHRAIQLQ